MNCSPAPLPQHMMLCLSLLQADPNNGAYTVEYWAPSAANRIRLQFTEVGAIDWGGAPLPALSHCAETAGATSLHFRTLPTLLPPTAIW